MIYLCRHVDRFIASFTIEKLEGKRSCDAINKQHGDVMPSSCHGDKDVWYHLYVCCMSTDP